MADLDELADSIDEQAADPQSFSADGATTQNRSLKDLDDHYDRVANRQAARNGRIPFSIFNTKPPGAT